MVYVEAYVRFGFFQFIDGQKQQKQPSVEGCFCAASDRFKPALLEQTPKENSHSNWMAV